MGMDPTVDRSILFYKRLNILRKAILEFNYREEVLRWGVLLDMIGQVYVTEYSIADKNGVLAKHFEAWEK